MTTSYILEKQEELKAIKKLERQAEKLIRDKEEAAKKAAANKGHYVTDDPSTPDINEAFVPKKTAPKKKVAPKKKAAAKPKAKARSKK